jgi:hypothetical protein
MSREAVLTAEILRECGLAEVPKIRYEDLPGPVGSTDTSRLVNWAKARQLVDPLMSARFERFIPDDIVIDLTIDTSSFKDEWSICPTVRRDIKPPVNDLVTRQTGITESLDLDNLMRWLALEIGNIATAFGTKRMGRPMVWMTTQKDESRGIYPLLGVMCKFDRTPPYGMTQDEMTANLGVLTPPPIESMDPEEIAPPDIIV